MSSRPKKQKSSSSGSEVEKSVKACLQVLKALQRSPAAFPFLEPVDWKALKLPTYPKMIKQPMDLGTVEMRLTSAKYATVADFIEQVNLIWDNAHAFNQDGSDIYDLATQLRRDFELRMRTGPAADSALRGGSKASAAPSSNSGLTQEDVQSCKSILKELKRKPDTEAFLQPVDWKLLGIPDYPTIIKRPMDLGTVNQQLDAAHYTSLQQAFAEGKFASLLSAAGASVESEDAPTELTFEMKHQLNQNASLLSSKDLFGMVGIVEANCKKALDQSNPSEVEIDIDTLDLQTFLKVEKYVQDCLRATKQSGALFRS
mmetsp:Transcript_3499/g.7896  ORF Transcript_3499/g.7896 Transcript_3499/m.7896 type:complete len:315 (-) Transcript_3499:225-1169(-)